jgi:hypothetical protein
MKKPVLLLTLKCAVVVYLLAFTGIDNFKKGKSATPLITKGNCSINLSGQDEFALYTFTFLPNGTVVAKKDAIEITGQWMEDNISKKINILFSTYNPTLSKLNNRWNIKDVKENQLLIESPQTNNPSLVTIASL